MTKKIKIKKAIVSGGKTKIVEVEIDEPTPEPTPEPKLNTREQVQAIVEKLEGDDTNYLKLLEQLGLAGEGS